MTPQIDKLLGNLHDAVVANLTFHDTASVQKLVASVRAQCDALDEALAPVPEAVPVPEAPKKRSRKTK